MEQKPAWVECDHCDEFICNIHGQHVHECPCPGIETWAEHDRWPYVDPWLTAPGETEICYQDDDE